MGPPRFRIRTLMIAVAIAATLMGGSIAAMRMSRLAEEYRQKAALNAGQEKQSSVFSGIFEDHSREIIKSLGDYKTIDNEIFILLGRNRESAIASATEDAAEATELAMRGRRRAAYFARLKRKYLRAASHPWEPVPPDPPVPQ